MKILLLGAGGFIGSHLVEFLLERDEHELVGVDITAEKLEGISGSAFTFHEMDIHEVPDDLVREADVVVDLIAYANPSIYVEAPLSVYQLNFEANMRIVDHCVRHGKRLVQYSTSEVYGKAGNNTSLYREDESDLVMGPVTKQRWIYAAAKQLLERVIHAYSLQGDLEYTIIRPFNFIGPRIDYLVPAGTMGGPRVFAHFMSALLEGGPMHLVDGGHVHRTFLSIFDANEAFQTILDHPEARNEIYNFGNPGNNTTIRDLSTLMTDIYTNLAGESPRSEVVEVSGETFYGQGYEDMDRVPPDISKLVALGWEPKHDLQKTLELTIGYYLSEAGKAAKSA